MPFFAERPGLSCCGNWHMLYMKLIQVGQAVEWNRSRTHGNGDYAPFTHVKYVALVPEALTLTMRS